LFALTPTLSPGERESSIALLKSFCVPIAVAATSSFSQETGQQSAANPSSATVEQFPLSPGERAGVRANLSLTSPCLSFALPATHPDMFTGIIEETGIVENVRPTARSIELTLRAKVCARGLKIGGSLAVNGCCLTAVKITPRGTVGLVRVDLLKETWNRTNLQFVRAGSLVNLERSLAVGGRLDGHFVAGHIDGTGKIIRWEKEGRDHLLEIAAPPEVMRYIVPKGSIAVDGISLTVAAARKKSFRVWIIPHTRDVTALRERSLGDAVNLEADLLGKYVRKFVTGSGLA